MRKLGLGILIGIVVLALSGVAVQALVFVPAVVQLSGVPLTVPDVAIGKSPVLKGIQAGSLERTIFIHYAKPPSGGGAKAPTCYALSGVKWKSLSVNYVVNPTSSGLSDTEVLNSISASTLEWDSHTSANLFGTSSLDSSANWDSDYPDGVNEYSWGNYSEPGVIAVAVVWTGIPIGGRGRQIIDYDVMFDTGFAWGNAALSGNSVMDLQNIATHETGHGIGLLDIYDSSCSAVTMYGRSSYGETQKRILEPPDITGLQKLYGN